MTEVLELHKGLSRKAARTRAIAALEAGAHPRRGEPDPPLPARILRRHAPAHHDRHGAVVRARPADRRRAHHGAGRDGAGPDHRAAARPAARLRHRHHPDHARPGRGRRAVRPGHGAVRRTHHGAAAAPKASSTGRPIPTPWACWARCPSSITTANGWWPSPGVPPNMARLPAGCPFSERCTFADGPLRGGPAAAGCRGRRRCGAARLPPRPPPTSRGGPRRCCREPTRSAEPLLSVRDLHVHFKVRGDGWLSRPRRTLKAVNGVSFDLYPGETLGIVGESGCGKSTLARAVLNLIPATSGQIVWMGRDMAGAGAGRLAAGAPQRADGVPGPAGLAQSAHERVADRRRAAAHPPAAVDRRRSAGARQGHAGAGGPERGPPVPLPARIFGRPVPAHRHRARAVLRAPADRLRRAGVGARRLDPGPDHQPAARTCSRRCSWRWCSSRTTWRWSST